MHGSECKVETEAPVGQTGEVAEVVSRFGRILICEKGQRREDAGKDVHGDEAACASNDGGSSHEVENRMVSTVDMESLLKKCIMVRGGVCMRYFWTWCLRDSALVSII